MSWFDRILAPTNNNNASTRHNIPEGVWTKCEACDQVLYRAELERNLFVCPKCNHHMKISARERLIRFIDSGNQVEIGEELEPQDILKFKDTRRYKERIVAAQKSTGEKDALVVIKGELKGIPVVCCAFEFAFMGGSMGSVVGARFIRAVETCLAEKRALICFATSGGARMQESLFSLMQMAKTSAALNKMAEAGLLAMLGDVNVAEPKALIGFAGPRVIEQTVREKLPEGFQHSEFLLEKGAIDVIVDRREMRERLAGIISCLMHIPFSQGRVTEKEAQEKEAAVKEAGTEPENKKKSPRSASQKK